MGHTQQSSARIDLQQLMLVYFLEPQPDKKTFARWPLHLTLLPWFFIKSSAYSQLNQQLLAISRITQPPVLRFGDLAWFGRRQAVPVRLVHDETGRLQVLHNELLRVVLASGATLIDSTHIHLNYRPHITIKYEQLRDDKARHYCDRMTLVQKRTGPLPNQVCSSSMFDVEPE